MSKLTDVRIYFTKKSAISLRNLIKDEVSYWDHFVQNVPHIIVVDVAQCLNIILKAVLCMNIARNFWQVIELKIKMFHIVKNRLLNNTRFTLV